MMSDRRWTQEQLIELAVESEWPNPTPNHLVGYFFDIDSLSKSIVLNVYFDAPVADDEKESMWVIEGRVSDHFPDKWQVQTKIEILAVSQRPDVPRSGTIYRRGDKETPLDRWRVRHAGGN